ncbi:MAG: MFS transporter [Burkholderiales bacterium]|nr:MFS transporter [Burkholderiales bacterium]
MTAVATRWPVVWMTFGAGIVAAAHVGKLPAALPLIRAELGVDLVTAGWIASLISVVSFALGIAAGGIADLVGKRRLVLGGLAAFAAGGVLGGFAPNAATLLVARFVEGLGFAAATVAGGALIAHATAAADRRWALGVWAAYMPIGFGGLLLLSPPLVEHLGWRMLWLSVAAVAALWAAAFHWATRAWRPLAPRAARSGLVSSVGRAVAAPGAALVAACFGLYAAQHISLMVWLPTMVTETWGTGLALAAAVPAAVLACNAAGSYVGARAMRRGVPLWLLLAVGSAGMGVAELGIFGGVLPPVARLAFGALFGVAGGLIPAAALAAAPVYAPSPALVGSVGGLMVMGSNAGQLFGPPALAAVRSHGTSWDSVVSLMLVMAVAGVACALASRPAERRLRTTPQAGG